MVRGVCQLVAGVRWEARVQMTRRRHSLQTLVTVEGEPAREGLTRATIEVYHLFSEVYRFGCSRPLPTTDFGEIIWMKNLMA